MVIQRLNLHCAKMVLFVNLKVVLMHPDEEMTLTTLRYLLCCKETKE